MAQIDPSEVEEVEVSASGRPLGLDLIRLEHTRFGLEVLGLGLAAYLIAMGLGFGAWSAEGPSSSRVLLALIEGLGLAGAALLAAGVLVCAPTPNGFLPNPLRLAFGAFFGLAVVVALTNILGPLDAGLAWTTFQEYFWLAARFAPLALTWILWRFCQHRGMIGRAIVWLWLALSWTLFALLVEVGEQFWVARLYPALGVGALFAAHLTARDLWIDAVNRKTKKVVAARGAASAEATTT